MESWAASNRGFIADGYLFRGPRNKAYLQLEGSRIDRDVLHPTSWHAGTWFPGPIAVSVGSRESPGCRLTCSDATRKDVGTSAGKAGIAVDADHRRLRALHTGTSCCFDQEGGSGNRGYSQERGRERDTQVRDARTSESEPSERPESFHRRRLILKRSGPLFARRSDNGRGHRDLV